MGGKGGGADNQTTATTYNTQLPAYAEGYYKTLMAKAQAENDRRVEEGLNPEGSMFYKGPRRATQSREEMAAADMRRDMFYNPDMAYRDYATNSMNRAAQVGNNIERVDGGGPFNAGIAQQYMSPYMDAVTNQAVRQSESRYQMDADQRREGSATAGGRGGYREAIMDSYGQSEHAKNIGDLWATGRQSAYQNAQGQYEADMRRRMEAGATNQGSQLALMGQYGGLGAQALDMSGNANNQDFQNISQFEGVGLAERADRQSAYDQSYNEWVNQRDWEMNQNSNMMGLLAGVPVKPGGTEINYAAQANPVSQAIGAGIGAYSLFGDK